MSDDERTLISRAMLGEEDDFARLVGMHYDNMVRMAWRFAGNRQDAQDIAQEACIKLARNLQTYRFEAPFGIWLRRIVMNTACDWARQQKRHRHEDLDAFADGEAASAAENPEQIAAARQLLRVVTGLPEDLRVAIILVHGEGLSHAQAAQVIGCAETTVSWRIHKARRKLAELMQVRAMKGGRHARA